MTTTNQLLVSLKDVVARKLNSPDLSNAFRQIENWANSPSPSGTVIQQQSWDVLTGFAAGSSGNTVFTTYSQPGSISFRKRFGGTKIRVRGTTSFYSTVVNSAVEFGINDNVSNTTFLCSHFDVNIANNHVTSGIGADISGLAIGPHVLTAQFRLTGAGENLSVDGNDNWLVTVTEVW